MALPRNIGDKETEKFVEDDAGNVAIRSGIRDLTGELKPRSAVIYDVKVRQYDTSFWKTLSGAPSVVSNKLRLNQAEICSYYQFLFGIFNFAVNIPTTPSAGEAKKIGLINPSSPTLGSAYFEIAGAVFKAVSYDDDGNAETTTLTWSGEATEQIFSIKWERDTIIFSLDGVVVATHSTRVGKIIQMLSLKNADNDNTDTGYVLVKETAKMI